MESVIGVDLDGDGSVGTTKTAITKERDRHVAINRDLRALLKKHGVDPDAVIKMDDRVKGLAVGQENCTQVLVSPRHVPPTPPGPQPGAVHSVPSTRHCASLPWYAASLTDSPLCAMNCTLHRYQLRWR